LENNIGMEILVVLAILAGPFIGIWAQSRIDKRRQSKERKLDVFKTLMATRATPLSQEHVRALNRIDMEFFGRKEKKVRNAWNTLLDHFGEGPTHPPEPAEGISPVNLKKHHLELQKYDNDFARWLERTGSLRTKLLKEMGASPGYDFGEVHIRKAAYNPRLHDDIEMTQLSVIKAINDVFTRKRSLPMDIVNWPEQKSDGDRSR